MHTIQSDLPIQYNVYQNPHGILYINSKNNFKIHREPKRLQIGKAIFSEKNKAGVLHIMISNNITKLQ